MAVLTTKLLCIILLCPARQKNNCSKTIIELLEHWSYRISGTCSLARGHFEAWTKLRNPREPLI